MNNYTHIAGLEKYISGKELQHCNALQLVWDTTLAFDPEHPLISWSSHSYKKWYDKALEYRHYSGLVDLLYHLSHDDINAKYLLTAYGYCTEWNECSLQSEEV